MKDNVSIQISAHSWIGPIYSGRGRLISHTQSKSEVYEYIPSYFLK